MSTTELEASPEQLCYIPCSFCNIVLAVSVPCSNLLDIVTVRCGNCANFCCVNMSMAALSSTSHDSSSSLQYDHQQDLNYTPSHSKVDFGSSSRYISIKPPSPSITNDQKTINRPPEKRTRVPSAYNQFIKQEIQRIKANDPNITHREAFSAAAKNWRPDANNHQEELNEMNYVQGSKKRLKSTTESFSI